jgi:DNA-binding NarL/FixJ family response regulator
MRHSYDHSTELPADSGYSLPDVSSRNLRLAIVEDDSRYRASLEQLFTHADGFTLSGSFAAPPPVLAEAERAMRTCDTPPWDVVLMDLEMPRMNGIEATRRLKALAPGLKIIVVTVFEDPNAIVEAICAGADGYLLKRARARELLDAVRAVADGGAPLTSTVARKMLDVVRALVPAAPARAESAPSRFDLTEREQQVLRALVDGLSYKQAADALGISIGTIRSHVTAIYGKLQVHNVAEAVSRAVRKRLV